MCCYRPVPSTMTSPSRSGPANAVGAQWDWSPQASTSSGTPSVIALRGFTDRASGSTTGQMIPRTDPTASGSATATGTRTVLSRPIRLLRPSPRVSFGSAASRRPERLNRCRCGPRPKDSTPQPYSVGFASTRSPACKPAIRFASFSGEVASGCWLIASFVGRERRTGISPLNARPQRFYCCFTRIGVDSKSGSTADQGRTGREDSSSRLWRQHEHQAPTQGKAHQLGTAWWACVRRRKCLLTPRPHFTARHARLLTRWFVLGRRSFRQERRPSCVIAGQWAELCYDEHLRETGKMNSRLESLWYAIQHPLGPSRELGSYANHQTSVEKLTREMNARRPS